MDNPPELTVLSLCTGYGGLELGLSRALENPLRVVAVEIEAYALANLVAKAEAGKLAIEALYPDLKTFPAERFSGCFDIILAGYPCQPFSLAGPQTCEDHESYIWPAIARIISATEPNLVFLENVPNHLNQGFDRVLGDLEGMGFLITSGLYSAAETGASIRSRRLFVLAQAVCDGHRSAQTVLCPRRQEFFDGMCGTGPPGPGKVGRIPRTVNDARYRVDRLRLCGNGVVPIQAQKAFEELYGLQIQTTKSPRA